MAYIFLNFYFHVYCFSVMGHEPAIEVTQLNTTENHGRRCLTPLSPHHYGLTTINKHCHFLTSNKLK